MPSKTKIERLYHNSVVLDNCLVEASRHAPSCSECRELLKESWDCNCEGCMKTVCGEIVRHANDGCTLCRALAEKYPEFFGIVKQG